MTTYIFRLSFRRTWVLQVCVFVLVGLVLFMLCMLSSYMTSLVVMSGTMSAQKRRLNRLDSQFFCLWVNVCLFMLFVLCLYAYWYLTRSHVVRVSDLLSPCLCWCWFVSLQIWNSSLQCGISTFIYKPKQIPVALVYANKL